MENMSTVTIDNTEARVRRLIIANHEPLLDSKGKPLADMHGDPRVSVTHKPVTFKPGLNYVDEIVAFELEADLLSCEELRQVTVENMRDAAAVDLAGRTSDVKALQTWRASETREKVIAAIDKQIAKIGPK